METFPLTAYSGWLNTDIAMPQDTQNDFYAIIFIPWFFKPFYGWVSDMLPIRGYHRKPYLIICAIGSATTYVLTGLVVHTSAGAFAVTFCRAFFNAFTELMLGIFLVDVAGKDIGNAGKIQAIASGARYLGGFVAYLSGLGLYSCDSSSQALSNSTIIALTAIFPIAMLLCSLTLHEEPQAPQLRPRPPGASRWNGLAFFLLVLLSQAFFILVGMQSLLPFQLWWLLLVGLAAAVLVGLGGLVLVAVVCAPCRVHVTRVARYGVARIQQHRDIALTVLFLFLYNAVPTADIETGNYQYFVFAAHQCKLQWLGMIGSAASVLASLTYSSIFNRKSIPRMLVLTAFLSSLSSLVFLPLARLRDPLDNQKTAFTYAALSEFAGGFFGQLAFLPALVLATERTPLGHAGSVYGIFLSFMNFGDTANGLITAPIVAAFNITYTNFENLDKLIIMGAACQVGALLFVPLLLVQAVKPKLEAAAAAGELSDEEEASAVEATNEEGSMDEHAPLFNRRGHEHPRQLAVNQELSGL